MICTPHQVLLKRLDQEGSGVVDGAHVTVWRE